MGEGWVATPPQQFSKRGNMNADLVFFCGFAAILPINYSFLPNISQIDQLNDQIFPIKAKISQTDQLHDQFN